MGTIGATKKSEMLPRVPQYFWDEEGGLPKEWESNEDQDFYTTPWCVFNPFFTSEECDEIISVGDSLEKIDGTITTDLVVDNSMRKCKISWLSQNPSTDWIYRKLFDGCHKTNFWKLDIRGYRDSIQYTTYSEKGDFYDFHSDTGPGMNHRKISMTVSLSDPDDYIGGDFEFREHGIIPKMKRGDAIMFPSWKQHKIHPITHGIRKTLVVWIAGPPIK